MPDDTREEIWCRLFSRISADGILQLLNAIGHPGLFVSAALRLAVEAVPCDRALAFGTDGSLATHVYNTEKARWLQATHLTSLVTGRRIRLYSARNFARFTRDREHERVVGMAGSLDAPRMALAVAVERDSSFCEQDRQSLGSLLQALANAFEKTAELRLHVAAESGNGHHDLHPLAISEINPFPRLREVEALFIEAALRRADNRKSKAAELLGVTREGLRKKLIRYRLASS